MVDICAVVTLIYLRECGVICSIYVSRKALGSREDSSSIRAESLSDISYKILKICRAETCVSVAACLFLIGKDSYYSMLGLFFSAVAISAVYAQTLSS